MKKNLLFSFLIISLSTAAQKIDSIYVNLYTDSLKRGTYNYINVDGLLSNGRYLPLDSTHLIFTASTGKFIGNSLWVAPDFKGRKILLKVVLRTNPVIIKEFEMYIKQLPDGPLKTEAEVLQGMKPKKRKGQ